MPDGRALTILVYHSRACLSRGRPPPRDHPLRARQQKNRPLGRIQACIKKLTPDGTSSVSVRGQLCSLFVSIIFLNPRFRFGSSSLRSVGRFFVVSFRSIARPPLRCSQKRGQSPVPSTASDTPSALPIRAAPSARLEEHRLTRSLPTASLPSYASFEDQAIRTLAGTSLSSPTV